MIAELEGFALMFRTSHSMFLRALEGLTDEDVQERIGKQNTMLWVASHTVAVRASFLRALGGKPEVPWAEQFPRGGTYEQVRDWPTLSDVRTRWSEVHTAFVAALETVTSEQVHAETRVPGLDKTLLGVVGLAALHDAYHIGQLGQMRRNFGLERLVG